MTALEGRETRARKRKADDRRRLREVLGAIILALYAAHRADPEQWLAYARRNDDYGADQRRYVHPHATAKAARAVVDFLTAVGLVEHRGGSFSRGEIGNRGTRSRARARPELIDLLEQEHGISPVSLGFAEWSDVVRLKAPKVGRGGSKQYLPYTDTPLTNGMREQLRDLNAFLSSFRIDLELSGDVAASSGERTDEPSDADDRSTVRLYRVFNNGRWDHGGRFYGGWWQAIPSQHRRRLLIDGEETVELDFKALHPRLCYHLDGEPLPADSDPYSIEGLDSGALRDVVKVVVNQLLNVVGPARLRAPKGIAGELPDGRSYAELVERVEQAHAPIAGWLRSGRGLELQYLDSLIAASVLGYMRSRDICCLSVHDSFIVPLSAEQTLGHAMLAAYRSILMDRAAVDGWPVISGWTSADIEEQARASAGAS